MSGSTSTLRADDREILHVLADGPLTSEEIAERIRRRAREQWSEEHGYSFSWDTDEEPVGARTLAHGEARKRGLKLLGHEIDARLRSLERRGAVSRIRVEGRRPMLWNSRV